MLSYRLVTTMEELESYKNTWSEILEREKNDNPFIEFEWVSTWWMTLGANDNVEIYIVEQNGVAVAFFPLVRYVRFGGIHYFVFLGQGFATYMEVIAEKQWKEPAIEYLLKELSRKYKRFILVLQGLLESKHTSQILEKYAIEYQVPYSIFRTVTPYIDFQSIKLEDFLYKHRKKFKTIQRREKKLKALGQVTFQEVHRERLADMFDLFTRRWQKKIDKSGFTEQQTRRFFERLATQKSNALRVEVDSLQFEGHWIGFTIDICCRDRNFCQAMGHEPDFNIFGPGRLIERENMLKAHASNYRFYDLGSGYEPYKFEWYTHVDFTRKFMMSTKGKRERTLRLMMVLFNRLKGQLTNNHQLVKLKRDRLGELRYFLKSARSKDWFHSFKKGINRLIAVHIFDIYVAENGQGQTTSNFNEVFIQDVMVSRRRANYVSNFHKGYRIFRNSTNEIAYLRHDQIFREEATGFTHELPSNVSYIQDHNHQLSEIVANMQEEGRAICTSVQWYERKRRRELVQLGFQRVERITIIQILKKKKVYRQVNNWLKYLQSQGNSIYHL
ncbi:GNAT family N-acetyltransferase [Lysinibacillus xylanilyticus]|uniref:GNAT family N-acetyltransferase n=1 Tax=Lysinibacillus xylanilyticus TaxID=582475 RepID=UPI00083C9A1D|nr:GNAT family N-acetyltransferase [Lysinibacillus xylanilyticus]